MPCSCHAELKILLFMLINTINNYLLSQSDFLKSGNTTHTNACYYHVCQRKVVSFFFFSYYSFSIFLCPFNPIGCHSKKDRGHIWKQLPQMCQQPHGETTQKNCIAAVWKTPTTSAFVWASPSEAENQIPAWLEIQFFSTG